MASEEKLLHSNIALICLRAISGKEIGRNYVLDNMHDADNKEGHTVFFLEYSA